MQGRKPLLIGGHMIQTVLLIAVVFGLYKVLSYLIRRAKHDQVLEDINDVHSDIELIDLQKELKVATLTRDAAKEELNKTNLEG
jgi:hypothetical protein